MRTLLAELLLWGPCQLRHPLAPPPSSAPLPASCCRPSLSPPTPRPPPGPPPRSWRQPGGRKAPPSRPAPPQHPGHPLAAHRNQHRRAQEQRRAAAAAAAARARDLGQGRPPWSHQGTSKIAAAISEAWGLRGELHLLSQQEGRAAEGASKWWGPWRRCSRGRRRRAPRRTARCSSSRRPALWAAAAGWRA